MTASRKLDLLIVGAGFAGMYMLHKARQLGLSALVVERSDEVGGCWYSTRYPGLRCDVESMQYSYSFDQDIQKEWVWPDRYSLQDDILRYAQFVADRLDLRRDIMFNTSVTSAHWVEAQREWEVRTDADEVLRATFVVLATGALSEPMYPDIPGLREFQGRLVHTSAWPRDLKDFEGQRVAIIGTGSSGVQIAAEAAKTAVSLHVIQRSVPYVIDLRNQPLDPAVAAEIKRDYASYRKRARFEGAGILFDFLQRRPVTDFAQDELDAELERCWQAGNSIIMATFTDALTNRESNDKIAEFIRRKIRSTVKDPGKVARVMPTSRFGAKRLAISTNYYDIFNQENVDAISLADTPIVSVEPDGIRTTAEKIPLDILVLATGYDAGTGPLKHIDVVGVGGTELNLKWATAPMAHLGLMSADFPNMFIVTGPGSPSVLSNVFVAIEQHVEWIHECLGYLRAHGIDRIEADPAAERRWFDHVNELAARTVYMDVDTWYNGGNVEGKAKCFMFYVGGIPEYSKALANVVSDRYRGFKLGA